MSFARLDELNRKLQCLSHAQSMLAVDEAVMMPEGGGAKRAETLAFLSAMSHDMMTAPRVKDWIDQAKAEPLDETQRIALHEFERCHLNRICLTSDFVQRQTETKLRCEQLWRRLRPAGDWAEFLPAFADVVALTREEAARRADALKLTPYDALIEQYDPGARVADIAPVFAELRSFLTGFIPLAVERQKSVSLKTLGTHYAIDAQKALGREVMQALGFDFNHGRLDVSHHPFCGGVPTDVRMTTRYRTDEFLSAFMGIMHETGHGLYEQGLPKVGDHWPSARARGMAMHESQSLLCEKQIGRNPAFWEWALPLLTKHFGETWSKAEILAHIHRVKPDLIRVDADEVTYPMHVILRVELEQDLVSGQLKAHDVPDAWNAKMKQYLDLSTKDKMRDGPMQDVHWPAGAFGYFPSYTLGALMAAQQWAAIERAHPAVNDDIAKGDFRFAREWCSNNIWQKASTASTPDLMQAATGESFNAKHFINHLQKRYS